jgi:hypothetical protein
VSGTIGGAGDGGGGGGTGDGGGGVWYGVAELSGCSIADGEYNGEDTKKNSSSTDAVSMIRTTLALRDNDKHESGGDATMVVGSMMQYAQQSQTTNKPTNKQTNKQETRWWGGGQQRKCPPNTEARR